MQLHAYAKSVLVDWDDRITLCMPMFHIYGNMGMCTSLVARWPMILVPNPRDLDDLIDTIRKTRPAVLHGVPTLFNSLLNHPAVQAGKVDFKSIKVCYSAAAPLLAETKHRFEALTGGWLLEAYAMTETMMAAVACPVHRRIKKARPACRSRMSMSALPMSIVGREACRRWRLARSWSGRRR